MADVVTPSMRSRMMSRIRSEDTKLEVRIRKALHAAGFRYRLHRRDLPGTPDITLTRFRAVIFVNGCFWHGHDCHLFKWPSTRPEFWAAKINGNRHREARVRDALTSGGWRICTVWECALRGRSRLQPDVVLHGLITWLRGSERFCAIQGSEDAIDPTG